MPQPSPTAAARAGGASRFNLIISGGGTGADNMSADMLLLDKYRLAGDFSDRPTLRIYFFSPPALSLGFSQRGKNIDEAVIERAKELGYDVVSRPTGGRAVLHKGEITYAVAASYTEGIFAGKLLETYKIISKFLYRFFIKLGLRPDVNGIPPDAAKSIIDGVRKEKDFNCFLKAHSYEITFSGKKICGNSQRRTGGAFLQHGSIYVDYNPADHIGLFEGGKDISGKYPGLDPEALRYFTGITGIKQEMEKAGINFTASDIGFDRLSRLLAESFAEAYGLEPLPAELPAP